MQIGEYFDFWRFLAGLGIFLLGMFMVEESLKSLAGRTFKRFLRKHTTNPLKGVLSGTVITALLQSSSVVTLMLLAFVGAEIITLRNAMGVIFGSNLGTTFTGWIVTFLGFKIDIESFSLPFIGIGGLLLAFYRKEGKVVAIGRFLVGFGFIFLGLEFMKVSIETFASQVNLTAYSDYSPYWFFPIGFVLTAIIQSSSASIVITLSALSSGLIGLPAAAAMVIGSDLGTTLTTMIGGFKGSPDKKRVALSHFMFNLITDTLAVALMFPILYVLTDVFGISDPLITLVAFHSSFNLLGIVIMLPGLNVFVRFLEKRFAQERATPALFIHKVPSDVTDTALEALKSEIFHLIGKVFVLALSVLKINDSLFLFPANPPKSQFAEPINPNDLYASIKQLEGEVVEFYLGIQHEKLEEQESNRLSQYIHAVRNAVYASKSMKDILHNIRDFEMSANDSKIGMYEFIKGKESEWYLELHRLFHSDKAAIYFESLVGLNAKNQKIYNDMLKEVYNQTRSGHFTELEISTLLNVNREIYNANRWLLLAIKDILLSKIEAANFNTIPEFT